MSFVKSLPLTRIKIYIAKLIFNFLKLFGFKNIQKVSRRNINFELNISEGIDLNVFLLGGYQKHVFGNNLNLTKDSIIVDVGANIGTMTLEFAKIVEDGNGKVLALEPTDFAYKKLIRNISLNPELQSKIITIKAFVSSQNSTNPTIEAYSSWNLQEQVKTTSIHPIHLGELMPTGNAQAFTLAALAETYSLNKIDLIKIDTDGHEYDILTGARSIIEEHKPQIIFECGIYILNEKKQSFKDFLSFFKELNYTILDLKSSLIVNENNFNKIIPLNSTIDLLATPH